MVITPLDAVHDVAPLSKPGLAGFWPEQPLPPGAVIVHENVVLPVAPEESFAVAVTEYVPAVAGVPEIRPAALIDRPAGSPVAVQV